MSTTPDEHGPPPPRGDAPDHVMANLFDSELERLAFGRVETPADRARAEAAASELARREADIARRSGEVPTPGPELEQRDRVRGADARARPERTTAPRWPRAIGIVAASILAATIVMTSLPTTPATRQASPLDVFERPPTAEEEALGPQLERDGLRLSVVPRMIAELDGSRIVAYRVVVTAPSERPRNEVCLIAVAERALGAPSCAERESVQQSGLQTSLAGRSGRYVVQWGISGAPTVSIVAAEASSVAPPRSIAAESFFVDALRDDDRAYGELLRALHPDDRLLVRVLSTTPTWDVVGALIASRDTGLWSYCVHVFTRDSEQRAQLGARVTCADRAAFERDGLVAQARTDTSTLQLDWRPDDTVVIDERVREDPAVVD